LSEYLKTPRPALIIALIDVLARKTENKYTKEIENLFSSLLSSNSYKTDFHNFIDKALKGKRITARSAPVGFLNEKTVQFLKDKKINFNGSRIITINSSFIISKKKSSDNRLIEDEWYKMLDYIAISNLFWDSKNNKIICLTKSNTDRFIKFSVFLSTNTGNPTIDEISIFNLSSDNADRISDHYSFKQILEMETIFHYM
jgi:hypothetical protein